MLGEDGDCTNYCVRFFSHFSHLVISSGVEGRGRLYKLLCSFVQLLFPFGDLLNSLKTGVWTLPAE